MAKGPVTQQDLDMLTEVIREWDQPGAASLPDHETPTQQWRELARVILESRWRIEHDRTLLAIYTEYGPKILHDRRVAEHLRGNKQTNG